MSDRETWCGHGGTHGQHWATPYTPCRGVTGDEAAVMALVFNCGPHPYGAEVDEFLPSRDDARRVIDALDQARGNE